MSDSQQLRVPPIILVLVGGKFDPREVQYLMRRVGLLGAPMSIEALARFYARSVETVQLAETRILLGLRPERVKYVDFITRNKPTSPDVREMTDAQRAALLELTTRALALHRGQQVSLPGIDQPAPARQPEPRGPKPRETSRASVLRQALLELDQPAHYRELFARTQRDIDKAYTEQLAYQTLYQDSRFRKVGDGVFALSDWKNRTTVNTLRWCPEPPVAQGARPEALFELVVRLHHWLGESPRTVAQLARYVLTESGVENAAFQDVLDVLYAVGLIEPTSMMHPKAAVTSMLPANTGIHSLRQACIEAFTQRVQGNARVLWALSQYEGTSWERLQKKAYGDRQGFDLNHRLQIWQAFGVVLEVEKQRWRLTAPGQAWAEQQPPIAIEVEEPAAMPAATSERRTHLTY